MNNITKEILSWNIKELFFREKHYYKIENLPDFFLSSLEYRKKFEPLFFEEFRAQILRFLEIELDFFEEWLCDINFFQKKLGRFFFSANFEKVPPKVLKKGDLLILSEPKNRFKNQKSSSKNFGIISKNTSKERKEIFIETNFSFWKQSFKTNKKVKSVLIRKISNLMNHVKEYLALSYFDHTQSFFKRLIFPVFKTKLRLEFKNKSSRFENHLNLHFNQSQFYGIISTLRKGMTLIQGPPGTGKTRTILGIIAIIFKLDQKKEKNKLGFVKSWETKKHFHLGSKIFFNPSFQNFSCFFNYGKFGKPTSSNCHSKKQTKLIICAPSNAAIDENVNRMAFGFPFQSRGSFNAPFNIIRLGPNYLRNLDHLSLENYSLVWSSEHDINIRFRIHSKIFSKARWKIIKKCSIIYTTLACTGYSVLKNISIKTKVIIDEAAQAVELSTLIPFKKNCRKIILVGDVQQLPATVFSRSSVDFEYDRSLFKRLQLRKHPVWFLETQYRMHPQISSFPARKFYQNGLKDSQKIGATTHFHTLRCFGPLNFFDICESSEQNHFGNNSAWCNLDEVRLISLLLRALFCLYSSFSSYSIGIITGYNGQIKEIQNFKINKKQNFEGQINTVDGFQGKENDIILLSCVRARIEKGIGFLSDCRRINVAFTRARLGFWIIGNSNTLGYDINWQEAITDIKKRKRFFCIRKPFERSSRRLIYWSIEDSTIFPFDGDFCRSISIQLVEYLTKKN